MGRDNPLTQKVNFSISVICLGLAALLGIVLMLEAAEMQNPIAEIMAQNMDISEIE